MNVKKLIATALVIGTIMTGSAFAWPHSPRRPHGSSHAIRWEHQRQVEHRHKVNMHRKAVRRHIAHKVMRNRARGIW